MTTRHLYWAAAVAALAVQGAMVLAYAVYSGWCFCSADPTPATPTPPVFVMRFMDAAVLPAAWMSPGLAVPLLVVQNLMVWCVAALALLYGMTLAARIRIRPAGGVDGRRIWLASPERMRAWQVLAIGCVLVGLGMAGGAMARRRWLSEAERVFAATMAAASTDRPLPPGVEFSMWEWRGDELVDVIPEPRYVARADPRESGDHLLDAFVTPYGYGGEVRLESGRRYDFLVYRRHDGGWGVILDQSPRRRR